SERCPFGLPKCDIKITAAPSSNNFCIVGMAPWILLSSVIWKSAFRGTLKSTRNKTFFPKKLAASIVLIVFDIFDWVDVIQLVLLLCLKMKQPRFLPKCV